MTDLHARWTRLATVLDMAPETRASVWAALTDAYQEPNRHYHTLPHIDSVTAQCDALRDHFVAPDTALLALFFHDIVYDPARSDNEHLSAACLREPLYASLDAEIVENACIMIEATRHHHITADPDTNLLLDIDMSILGAPWPDYLAYARGVAREYLPAYGMDAYATGRVNLFLVPTLEKPNLFLTPHFTGREDQARKNLREEAALWSSGTFDTAGN